MKFISNKKIEKKIVCQGSIPQQKIEATQQVDIPMLQGKKTSTIRTLTSRISDNTILRLEILLPSMIMHPQSDIKITHL